MKSWNELTNLQRAFIGIAMVIAAAFLPEIAFLVQLGGMEVAFALVFASLAPIISWFSTQLKSALKPQWWLLGIVHLLNHPSLWFKLLFAPSHFYLQVRVYWLFTFLCLVCC